MDDVIGYETTNNWRRLLFGDWHPIATLKARIYGTDIPGSEVLRIIHSAGLDRTDSFKDFYSAIHTY